MRSRWALTWGVVLAAIPIVFFILYVKQEGQQAAAAELEVPEPMSAVESQAFVKRFDAVTMDCLGFAMMYRRDNNIGEDEYVSLYTLALESEDCREAYEARDRAFAVDSLLVSEGIGEVLDLITYITTNRTPGEPRSAHVCCCDD